MPAVLARRALFGEQAFSHMKKIMHASKSPSGEAVSICGFFVSHAHHHEEHSVSEITIVSFVISDARQGLRGRLQTLRMVTTV